MFQTSLTTETLPKADNDLTYWLTIYIGISLASSIIGTLGFFWIFTGSLRASRKLFEGLTFTVLRTPLRWVDTVPLGRILNRFTADFNVVDSRLAFDMSFTAGNALQLVGIIVAG
jgi:ABC-type multidrug transport system fused ATPase/permease subunit